MKEVFKEIQDFSSEDKVRYVSLKVFSSYLFLLLTFFYTIPVLLNFVSIIHEFSIENVIMFILNFLIAFGLWKTYAMAKNGKIIDTGGLRIIRGFLKVNLIILGLIVAFLVIYTILAGFVTFLLIIPLTFVGYALFIFIQAITTAIASLEDGSLNTDYYSAAITWLLVFMSIYVLSVVLMLTFDTSSIPQLIDNVKEAFKFTLEEKRIIYVNLGVTVLSYFILISFIKRLKFYIESIQTVFPKVNNIQLDQIDFKISTNVLESDSQINDARKYEKE